MRRFSYLLPVLLLLSAGSSPALAQEELVYVAVEPCRVANTVQSGQGLIEAGTIRNFRVFGTAADLGDQGGTVDCENPRLDTPVAAAVYLIARRTANSGNGNLFAFPSDTQPVEGSGSTVNFTEGQNIGNTTIVSLCTDNCPSGGELGIRSNFSEQHVLIDVQGYFYPKSDGVAFVDGQTSLPFGSFSDVAALDIAVKADGYMIVNFNARLEADANVETVCGLALNGVSVREDIARTAFPSASKHTISFAWGLPVQKGDALLTARCKRDSSGANPTLSDAALTAVFSSNTLFKE